ncbi:MAG: hypothetical protein GU361_06460 [Desulfurococcales archaeon]|jgi:hypothetical protein|nr:hypothetical protein [Desulfurococcales archaeon]
MLREFISSVISGIFVERYREKRRREAEHLRDIKQRCLEPLLRELQGLKERLMISEARPLHVMCEQLESEPRWWERYSFRGVTGVDPLLYEDLKNHYRDIYQDLEDIEAWVRTKYPDYLLAVCKLLEKISGDPEFKEFKAELERMHAGEEGPFIREDFPQNVILFLTLDVDKDLWPNIYPRVKTVMDKAIRLKEKFYMIPEAQRAREEMHSIIAMIDNCIDKTKKASHQTKLHGKCGYL